MTDKTDEGARDERAKEIIIDGVTYVAKPKLVVLEEPANANTELKQLNG